MHYDEARKLLDHASTGREMPSRKVGNNTTMHRIDDDTIALRLHDTDVVTWNAPARTVTLDTGGWLSVTTKERMNRYAAPFQVWSVQGAWRVGAYLPNEGKSELEVPYFDGITLRTVDAFAELQRVYDSPDVVEARELLAVDKATKKKIGAYLRGLTAERWERIYRDAADNGTAGDCLFCNIAASNPGAEMGTEHLASHVDERYYMVTLALCAVREAGYREPTFILAHGGVDMIRRALRRYLESRLLVGASGGRRGNAGVAGLGYDYFGVGR